MTHGGNYTSAGNSASTPEHSCADNCAVAQNDEGTQRQKWHKTDTDNPTNELAAAQKKTAAALAGAYGGHSQEKKYFQRQNSHDAAENQDVIAAFDSRVMAVLAAPRDNRRNGRLCFTKRSRLARELGCTRDVLNASIRRLIAARRLRTAYLPALGKSGLEIVEPIGGLAVRYD